jgi:16S rRNA (adenine1518-N6/adenine1519-N6)-dimethyltransferase
LKFTKHPKSKRKPFNRSESPFGDSRAQSEQTIKNRALEIRARKEFSQNFLTDQGILDRMEEVVADSVRTSENGSQRPSFAVEIGPGMGALTRRLLRHIDVHAIEKDIRAVDYLKQHFEQAAPQPHILNVTQGDILRFEPYILAQQASSGTADPAVPLSPAAAKPLLVGNLPYAISSDFLLWYSRAPDAFTAGHFLLQKEVVDRLVAPVGSKSYGRLGVLMSLYFRTVVHFDVPPEAFEPRPNVTSTFFSLKPMESMGPLATADSASAEVMGIFERCTAELFSRRRKMLRKSLEHLFTLFEIPYAECKDAVVTLLGTFGITPEDRPERIPPQGFLALARFLHSHGAKTRQMDSKTEETP